MAEESGGRLESISQSAHGIQKGGLSISQSELKDWGSPDEETMIKSCAHKHLAEVSWGRLVEAASQPESWQSSVPLGVASRSKNKWQRARRGAPGAYKYTAGMKGGEASYTLS